MPADELLGGQQGKEEKEEKKKKIQMLVRPLFYCKEYGLVCAEVHFCQDALGFHGASDERDHTATRR